MPGTKTKETRIRAVLLLQGIIIVYTFSGVFGKLATQGHAFLSPKFLLFVVLDLLVLACYALLWQQILTRFDLHVAYANRSMATVWGLVWAAVIFGEQITGMNIAGTACILAGTLLVNADVE